LRLDKRRQRLDVLLAALAVSLPRGSRVVENALQLEPVKDRAGAADAADICGDLPVANLPRDRHKTKWVRRWLGVVHVECGAARERDRRKVKMV